MAAAFFNRLANPEIAKAISAGTRPGSRVHPEVVSAMKELGFDLSDSPTTLLTSELARQATTLVTMGCGDECPYVPGVAREDWPLEGPKGQTVERVGVRSNSGSISGPVNSSARGASALRAS
jgi:arsenate reductase